MDLRIFQSFKKMLKLLSLNILRIVVKTHLSKLLIYLFLRFTYFDKRENQKNTQNVLLILNRERFKHDLESLRNDQRVKLLILPSRIQTLINSLFLNTDKSYLVDSYINSPPEVEELLSFVSKFILALDKKYNLNAILTCSFYYRQDFPYQFSYSKTNIPFYALFKEYLKDDCTYDATVKRYKERGYKFKGKSIFCANKIIRDILLEANICEENQMSIVGSPRFDLLHGKTHDVQSSEHKIVTLFSFLHSSGGLEVNDNVLEGNFFSNNKNKGFYNLFEQVHVSIAELALKYPEKTFFIKSKWGGLWHEKIISIVLESSGIDITQMDNVILDYKENAQSLIKRSSVVIAFNSTTVIEASLLKKNVVLPIFCEAKEKYFNTNVLYKEFLDSLIVASSKDDLKDKIMNYAKEEDYNRIPEKMVKKFIHLNDGKSGERIVDEILQKNRN